VNTATARNETAGRVRNDPAFLLPPLGGWIGRVARCFELANRRSLDRKNKNDDLFEELKIFPDSQFLSGIRF